MNGYGKDVVLLGDTASIPGNRAIEKGALLLLVFSGLRNEFETFIAVLLMADKL